MGKKKKPDFSSDSDSHSPSPSRSKERRKKRRKREKELSERATELECELDEYKAAHDDDMKAKDKLIEKWKMKYDIQLNKKKQAQQRFRRLKRRWAGGVFIPGKKSGPRPASLTGLSPRQIKRRRLAFSKDVTETVARIGLRHNMNLSDIAIYMYGVKLIMPSELQLQNADRMRAESDEEHNRNKFSGSSSEDEDSDDDDMLDKRDDSDTSDEKRSKPPLAPKRNVAGGPPPPPLSPPPPPTNDPPPPPPPGTRIAPLYGMHVSVAHVPVNESAQVLDFDAFEPTAPPPPDTLRMLQSKPLPPGLIQNLSSSAPDASSSIPTTVLTSGMSCPTNVSGIVVQAENKHEPLYSQLPVTTYPQLSALPNGSPSQMTSQLSQHAHIVPPSSAPLQMTGSLILGSQASQSFPKFTSMQQPPGQSIQAIPLQGAVSGNIPMAHISASSPMPGSFVKSLGQVSSSVLPAPVY